MLGVGPPQRPRRTRHQRNLKRRTTMTMLLVWRSALHPSYRTSSKAPTCLAVQCASVVRVIRAVRHLDAESHRDGLFCIAHAALGELHRKGAILIAVLWLDITMGMKLCLCRAEVEGLEKGVDIFHEEWCVPATEWCLSLHSLGMCWAVILTTCYGCHSTATPATAAPSV